MLNITQPKRENGLVVFTLAKDCEIHGMERKDFSLTPAEVTQFLLDGELAVVIGALNRADYDRVYRALAPFMETN